MSWKSKRSQRSMKVTSHWLDDSFFMIRLERIPWLWNPLFILLYSADSVQCNCVDLSSDSRYFSFKGICLTWKQVKISTNVCLSDSNIWPIGRTLRQEMPHVVDCIKKYFPFLFLLLLKYISEYQCVTPPMLNWKNS
jgi:hypothetical protein